MPNDPKKKKKWVPDTNVLLKTSPTDVLVWWCLCYLDLQPLAQWWKHLSEDNLLVPHWVRCRLLGTGATLRGNEGKKKIIHHLNTSSSQALAGQTHHLFEEADHHIGVDEGSVVSDEGLGDVGHDAGVVSWEALGSIHLQEKSGPGPLGGETFRDQKVPEEKGKDMNGSNQSKRWHTTKEKLNRKAKKYYNNLHTQLESRTLSPKPWIHLLFHT